MLISIFIKIKETNKRYSINCNTAWTIKAMKDYINDQYSLKIKQVKILNSGEIKNITLQVLNDDLVISDLFKQKVPVAFYCSQSD
jgi:hypothetical protein